MSERKTPNQINNPDFWNSNADYRNIVSDFTTFYSQQAWRLAALPQQAHVLDIAAGGGALTKLVSASGNRVLATDFSEGMVDSIGEMDLPGVEVRVMDGQDLILPDASFDAVFSIFGIMLFEDWNRGLSEMARVLKPGGLACIGTWAEESGAAANLLVAQIAEQKFPDITVPVIAPGMAEWTDQARFHAALETVSLNDLEFHKVSSDFCIDAEMLSDPDRLFQFSPIWPLLAKEQKSCLLDTLAELAEGNGGTIGVASPAIIAIGRKISTER